MRFINLLLLTISPLFPAVFRLVRIADQKIAGVRWLHLTATVLIDVELDLGDLPPVVCDISKINQILLNIILNGAQSIEVQGFVRINTCRIGEFVLIEIKDNGCGISEADLTKVFTPFYTTKETGQGTGLGLSVCYSIIQGHGGDIDITSEENAGTIVRITLPINHLEMKVM